MTKILDNISKNFGDFSGWMAFILVILVGLNVFFRYVFNINFNALAELEWHLFTLIFLLCGASNILSNKHVRVDVFYHKFSEKTKHIIDLVGHLIFLVPWCILGIFTCYNYASNSFYINESSSNPGGLPFVYILKFVVVLSFLLLLLQSISEVIKSVKFIKES